MEAPLDDGWKMMKPIKRKRKRTTMRGTSETFEDPFSVLLMNRCDARHCSFPDLNPVDQSMMSMLANDLEQLKVHLNNSRWMEHYHKMIISTNHRYDNDDEQRATPNGMIVDWKFVGLGSDYGELRRFADVHHQSAIDVELIYRG